MERDAMLVISYFKSARSQATCTVSHPCCISTAHYGLGVLLQQKPPLSMGCWPSRCRNAQFALVREEVATTNQPVAKPSLYQIHTSSHTAPTFTGSNYTMKTTLRE